jgi:hypothetical protein
LRNQQPLCFVFVDGNSANFILTIRALGNIGANAMVISNHSDIYATIRPDEGGPATLNNQDHFTALQGLRGHASQPRKKRLPAPLVTVAIYMSDQLLSRFIVSQDKFAPVWLPFRTQGVIHQPATAKSCAL